MILTNPEGVDRRAVSDADGAYVFGGLQPGTYRIRIEEPGPGVRPFATSDLPLAPGEQRQFDIRLQPVPPPPPLRQAAPTPQRPAPTAPRVTGVDTAAPQRRGDAPPVPEVTAPGGDFEAVPNRWNFRCPTYERYVPPQRMPWVVGGPFDPYNQNPAKGDPDRRQHSLFANVNLQLNSAVNPRQVGAGRIDHDAAGVQQQQLRRGRRDLPRRHRVPTEELGGPRHDRRQRERACNVESTSQSGSTYGVEEAFAEKRLAVIGPSFDFVSIRGGMQNFNSDFRGYLFVDNQLGVRALR